MDGGKVRVFRDTISSLKLRQFRQINGLNNSSASPSLTDHLLSFSPLQYPLSQDGYFSYLDPCNVDDNLTKTKPFTRRLWGGGSTELYGPLQFDKVYTCLERIKKVRETSHGVYITLSRTILDESVTNVTPLSKEVRTLVYTNSMPVRSYNSILPNLNLQEVQLVKRIKFTVDDIVKYNILSLNPHKIHWDKIYSVGTEGYKNIIVPGPYILQLVTNLIERHSNRTIRYIKYRNINYIYPETLVSLIHYSGDTNTFWLIDDINRNLIYFTVTIT